MSKRTAEYIRNLRAYLRQERILWMLGSVEPETVEIVEVMSHD